MDDRAKGHLIQNGPAHKWAVPLIEYRLHSYSQRLKTKSTFRVIGLSICKTFINFYSQLFSAINHSFFILPKPPSNILRSIFPNANPQPGYSQEYGCLYTWRKLHFPVKFQYFFLTFLALVLLIRLH